MTQQASFHHGRFDHPPALFLFKKVVLRKTMGDTPYSRQWEFFPPHSLFRRIAPSLRTVLIVLKAEENLPPRSCT